LRGVRHRNEGRRYGLDVLAAWFLRERPHPADGIVFEMSDLGRYETVDPSVRSHDVGEDPGPLAVARVNVDDGRARIDARELDQFGDFGLFVHGGWCAEFVAVSDESARSSVSILASRVTSAAIRIRTIEGFE
jgi:hypothetical protein